MTTTALAGPDDLPARLAKGRRLADAAFGRTLAALNGDGGVAPHLRARPDWATCPAQEWPLVPIESDALDRRQEARLAVEDEARAAYWDGDRNGDYEWSTL